LTDNPNTVLAFMAHPDDAEMLCGGTLIRLADAGWSVHIATATAGDCGTTSETPLAISLRRTEEARRGVALLGGFYHCLDEKDGFVVYDKPTLRKSIDLLRDVAPSLVLTHAPKDYMMDHEMVSLLGRGASFIHAMPNASPLPLRERARVPHLYYCDPVEALDPFGREVAPTTFVDVSSAMERKARMLACHESQRDWLRAHHGVDEYVEAMKRHGAYRGRQVGVEYAEAFVQHLGHAMPRNDLLAELFGGPGSQTE
jgi:LmbE family N-acetylglucosaminyl deacetylase